MKLDQIAFYARTDEEADRIKEMFGLQDAKWLKDKVTAASSVYGELAKTNVAELQFNYDLGVELEILRYVHGPSWHDKNPFANVWQRTFISHVGIHLADDEDFPEMVGCELVQETKTVSHTSQYLIDTGRKYHYKIFMLSPGAYIKYIKRVHADKT